LYWAHFINFFQPPIKTNDYIRKAARTCYLPLIEVLEAHPKARITVNLAGALAERLRALELGPVLDGLRRLAQRGQIELTASAYGGPILGTIPEDEMKALIAKNTQAVRAHLGNVFKPAGFFPPEMSYDGQFAPVVAALGYQWMILDEMAHSGKPGTFLSDRVYLMEGLPQLKIIFRDRSMSTGILYGSFDGADAFVKAQEGRMDNGHFVVTGTEADLYGMRRTGPRDFLVDMIRRSPVTMVTVSEAVRLIGKREPVRPVAASWSTWDTLAF
jgi:alpha-amylase/alpha-mannosidase (GH57 family)